MRLLRFFADRGPGFRSYIFARYFRRFLLMSLVLLIPLLAGFLYIPFGPIGALGGAFACLLALTAVLVGPAALRRLPRVPRQGTNHARG